MSDMNTQMRLDRIERLLDQQRLVELPIGTGQSTFYEEGTWTPTYLGGTTAGVTTYSVQEGNYTRIGRLVVARGRVVWTAATGTGQARISLPHTVSKTAAIAIWTDSVTFGALPPYGLVQDGVSYLTMWLPASNASSTVLSVESAGDVRFEATYFI